MDIRLSDSPQGPLKGIRVIDIAAMITGPLCAPSDGPARSPLFPSTWWVISAAEA
jgi:hypothetical protein